MNIQSFIPYIPFLAVVYALYAFGQTLRHKRQGTVAILLALASIAAPLIAYILSSDSTVMASLTTYLAINAAIVFVASLVILFIERRNSKRDPNHSYGILGLGLSLVLAIGVFGLSLAGSSASGTAAGSKAGNAANPSGLILVSAVTTGVPISQNGGSPAAEATQSVAASTPTEVATVLTAQTGLSVDELLSRIQADSTIADLVKANNGTVDPIVSTIAKTLDTLLQANGPQAQMLNSLGSDTTEIATQLVEGTLGQAQQFLLPQLITGQAPTPPSGQGGNGAPPNGQPVGAPNAQVEATAEVSGAAKAGSTDPVLVTNTPQNQQQSSSNTTSQAQPTATETVIRPTQIVFPTATPTVIVTAMAEAAGTETTTTTISSGTTASCSIVVDYNLNLRDQPTTDGSTVYLSIPFGTTVTADGRTTDGWYRVTYNGQKGWVNNAYLTASSSCVSLEVFSEG